MNQSPATPKHHDPKWPMIAFGIAAVIALVAILAFETSGDESTEMPVGGPGMQVASCEQGVPPDFEIDDVVGKSFSDVEVWATERGNTVRPVMIDGEAQIQTMDYRTDRINVEIEDDTVTQYCGNY